MVVVKHVLCDITFMLKRRVFMCLCVIVLSDSAGVWANNSACNSLADNARLVTWCYDLLLLVFCLWLYIYLGWWGYSRALSGRNDEYRGKERISKGGGGCGGEIRGITGER